MDDLVIGFAMENELMQARFQLTVTVFQFQHLSVSQRHHHSVLRSRAAQTKALGVVREVPAAGGAIVRVRAFPARFSGMQPELKGNAPSIGEHTAAVAAELRG
mgnify:CR=1 FL=1